MQFHVQHEPQTKAGTLFIRVIRLDLNNKRVGTVFKRRSDTFWSTKHISEKETTDAEFWQDGVDHIKYTERGGPLENE